jgi:hypothetical protein
MFYGAAFLPVSFLFGLFSSGTAFRARDEAKNRVEQEADLPITGPSTT